MATIHDRMSVILQPEDEKRRISPGPLNVEELHRIFSPYSVEEMEIYPISDQVNNPSLDDEKVIAPVKEL
jgi:putative SOS response-associated peptidase YedK